MPSPAPPLTPDDWQQLSARFDEVLALPASQRAAWLAAQTGLTAAQHSWLVQMLDAHATQGEDDWLERGPQWPTGLPHAWVDAEAQGLTAGARVGPWVLHELLGAGGMATVWRATRADALPAREVALKLPLLHRSGSRLAERFAREREILARLSHPHIAPLYAAGVAPDGTPWLAMELVHGEPLPQWCDARHLGLAGRLALFQQVLDAVVYAHAQLVIHRDLKPSNILVTPQGQVRLLDFGIAKLLGTDAGSPAAAADLTQAAQPFTPAYAAPEQLNGQPLTTATDLYTLGVVLFELLTGTRPYRFSAGTSLPTAAQTELAILDGQTLRASSALTEAAAADRGTSLAKLRRQLRGDLDTILAKALKLSPRERYASVAEFGDDLDRWIDHAPVRARPDSRRYRLGRFVRRYRVPVAAGTVVMLSLAAALTVSLVQVQRADRQRDLALAQRGVGTAMRIFLMDQLVVLAREGQVPDLPTLLQRTETSARAAFARDPDELALALLVIGGQRRNFDGPEQALPGLNEALEIAIDPNLRAEISCDRAAALYAVGKRSEALIQVRRASADTRLIASSRATCLDYQVLLEMAEGDLEAALRSETISVAMARTAPDMPRRGQDRARMVLTYLQAMTGRNANPDPIFEAMLSGLRAAERERSLTGLELKSRWANVKLAMGDAARALALIDENRRGSLGPPASPALPSFLRTQALALEALGRDAEALEMFDDAARLAAAAHDTRLAVAAACLAVPVALRLGDANGARLEKAQAELPAGLGATDEPQRACTMARAELALAQGRFTQVDTLLAPLLAESRLTLPQRASALLLRARAALRTDDAARAGADAAAALDLARRMQGDLPASFRSAAALAVQGDANAARGDLAQARADWLAAQAQYSATVDATHPELRRLRARLRVS